jgi:hypothetical protein
MIKAEVIEHEGYEVPNWVAKCKDVIGSTPVLAALTLVVIAGFSVLVWNHNRPAYTNQSNVQSTPADSSALQVFSSDNLPAQANGASLGALSGETPIGPAPLNSLDQLQSTGVTQNNVGGLTQALSRTLQASSDRASSNILQLLSR